MAKAALVLSIVAILIAAWSGWSAHRSAQSSESSARSAAEGLEPDRDRRHEERTPHLPLLYDRQVGNSEALWLLNNSRESYQVRLALLPREEGGPVEALHVATNSGGVAVVREGNEFELEAPLAVGGKQTPPLRQDSQPARRHRADSAHLLKRAR